MHLLYFLVELVQLKTIQVTTQSLANSYPFIHNVDVSMLHNPSVHFLTFNKTTMKIPTITNTTTTMHNRGLVAVALE